MKVKFLGHAAVLLQGPSILLIDPFLKNNPQAVFSPKELKKIDFVLVTHDHFDHLGEAKEICQKSGATLIAIHELASSFQEEIKTEGMNIGGKIEFQELKIFMTEAWHSLKKGHPAGFLIEMEGKRIYHAGDTALFPGMQIFRKRKIDLAFLPIGDRYTMGPEEAALAVEYLKPDKIVPIHYNTWPLIKQDPYRFRELVKESQVIILSPGQEIEI